MPHELSLTSPPCFYAGPHAARRLLQNLKHLGVLGLAMMVALAGCGIEDERGSLSRRGQAINGGSLAQIADYPATVAIINSWGNTMVCTGTLIEPAVVLTAAHCLHLGVSVSAMRVVYGQARAKTAAAAAKTAVASGAEHPNFYTGTKPPLDADGMGPINDIALLFLKAPITGAITAPILPAAAISTALVAGKDLRLVGFGYDGPTSKQDGVLYTALSPLVKRTNNEMSVGYQGTSGPCRGDSGGPAYLQVGQTLMIAGLTSRGVGRGTNNCPTQAIYTIPAGFQSWIDSLLTPAVDDAGQAADAQPSSPQTDAGSGASTPGADADGVGDPSEAKATEPASAGTDSARGGQTASADSPATAADVPAGGTNAADDSQQLGAAVAEDQAATNAALDDAASAGGCQTVVGDRPAARLPLLLSLSLWALLIPAVRRRTRSTN